MGGLCAFIPAQKGELFPQLRSFLSSITTIGNGQVKAYRVFFSPVWCLLACPVP